MQFGAIKQQKLKSPLEGLAQVRPRTGALKVLGLAAPLMLTSLVDAFAVIVIYLLVSTQQGVHELKVDRDIKLPQASQSQSLQQGVNVRFVKGQYIVNDQSMNMGQLLEYLTDLNKKLADSGDERKGNIIIQADKESDFNGISPILSVAAQTGFENVKFAVLGD